MNKAIFILIFLFAPFATATDSKAQSSDPQIELLQKSAEIIGTVNRLPVNFQMKTVKGELSEEISAEGLANLKKTAALLNQLPAGTVVEIGAHIFPLEDTLAEKGGPEAEVSATANRAELVRRELVRLGVRVRLTAQGYGATKPLASNQTVEGQLKNQRIEYLIAKLPAAAAQSSAPKSDEKNAGFVFSDPREYLKRQNGAASTNAVVAGRGWGKIVIGAARSDIEAALGEPERFYEGNMLLPDPSAQYFSKGVVVVYDAVSGKVKQIDFVGDPSFIEAGNFDGTFRQAAAKPDKNVAWGAGAAQIIAAYGEPKDKLIESRNGADTTTLTYDQITFTLNADRLYYIVVTADNDRFLAARKKQKEERSSYRAVESEPLDYTIEYTIMPGAGAGGMILGATRADIEAVLGPPDEFVDEQTDIFPIYEAHYFSKGIKIEYDPKKFTQHILTEGTVEEKREMLANLRGKILLTKKVVSVE